MICGLPFLSTARYCRTSSGVRRDTRHDDPLRALCRSTAVLTANTRNARDTGYCSPVAGQSSVRKPGYLSFTSLMSISSQGAALRHQIVHILCNWCVLTSCHQWHFILSSIIGQIPLAPGLLRGSAPEVPVPCQCVCSHLITFCASNMQVARRSASLASSCRAGCGGPVDADRGVCTVSNTRAGSLCHRRPFSSQYSGCGYCERAHPCSVRF